MKKEINCTTVEGIIREMLEAGEDIPAIRKRFSDLITQATRKRFSDLIIEMLEAGEDTQVIADTLGINKKRVTDLRWKWEISPGRRERNPLNKI